VSDEALLSSLSGRVRSEVGRAVQAGPVALLDFPDYGNPGDSAIWLGAIACLASLGLEPPVYTSDQRTFDEHALRRALPSGTILITGGGNFGDLWPRHEAFRERVVAAFPDHAIVQLPQTIHFENRDALASARRVLGGHRDLTLLVRDEKSLDVATNQLGCRAALCPDLAFSLERSAEPSLKTRVPSGRAPVLRLFRTDHESGCDARSLAHAVDWAGPEALSPLERLERFFGASHRRVARQRLRRGTRLLQSARVVITDRLHGHVLSLLLGIPHVVIGDRNGKLRRFIDTWTSSSTLLHWADTADEADRIASGLLQCS
jgi:exopolysaccharide biosynthesis predicted pyruvyltransferase EpsI